MLSYITLCVCVRVCVCVCERVCVCECMCVSHLVHALENTGIATVTQLPLENVTLVKLLATGIIIAPTVTQHGLPPVRRRRGHGMRALLARTRPLERDHVFALMLGAVLLLVSARILDMVLSLRWVRACLLLVAGGSLHGRCAALLSSGIGLDRS
jgi:hypothetical protein